ncbi:MAG: glycosyltransferase [Nitratireductor sp.]|jgi:glycosyltransferase involved in cell wall biosynthesis|nr:glycosyltransferase [Nitratireductor sp.]
MPAIESGCAGSVIIPAYNEEAGIVRCLSALLRSAHVGEFEVIVVCNGCTDRTAAVARAFGRGVRVLELAEGCKTAAINAGNAVAGHQARLYLDADLELSTANARALLSAVREGGWLAAVGRMKLDLSGAPALLRQYYAVWAFNGYLARGKFGGAYALSAEGREIAGPLPRVINDDEYMRRKIPAERVCHLSGCSFTAHAPKTIRDLYKVRRRVHRGNRQLAAMGLKAEAGEGSGSLVATALRKPRLWAGLAAYVAINLLARRSPGPVEAAWERDESTRQQAVAGQA